MSGFREVVALQDSASVGKYSSRPNQRGRAILLLIVLISLAVGFTLSNLINSKTISRQAFLIQTSGSSAISEAQLLTIAEQYRFPIYWSGPLSGYSYLLNLNQDGSSVLKYIPESGTVASLLGAKREIATYIDSQAWEKSLEAANKVGFSSFKNADGSLVFYETENASDVYVAFEERTVQIEIFDSRAGQALSLALLEGEIRPIAIYRKG